MEAEQTASSGGREQRWHREAVVGGKLGINVSTPDHARDGRGWPQGWVETRASGAFNGALQAFERSVVSAVASEAGKEVFMGMKGALGAFARRSASPPARYQTSPKMPCRSSGKGPRSTLDIHEPSRDNAERQNRRGLDHLQGDGQEPEADHPSRRRSGSLWSRTSKAAKASFKLVMPKAKTYSLMVITGEHQTEEESEYLEVTREMLDAISDDMNADPANKELLAELRAAFVNENVPMDRGIRALAVAHTFYVNAPSLRGELVTLFQDEAEIRDLYTGYLPASMHAGADTLNTYYHLALSAEDHTLYLRLNTAFAERLSLRHRS